ncbi:MAG: hypothetical protein HY204_00840 [Nitrospirae bacterium]|nr:hypothetical protein [Nitrospirota bacterium]
MESNESITEITFSNVLWELRWAVVLAVSIALGALLHGGVYEVVHFNNFIVVRVNKFTGTVAFCGVDKEVVVCRSSIEVR